MYTCDLGDAVKLSTVFSVAGVPTDPTTISLELKSPSKVVTTYTYAATALTKTGTGAYYKVLSATILNAAGIWRYSWIGTGAAEGVDQGSINVQSRDSA
jgi:hypothetical protein